MLCIFRPKAYIIVHTFFFRANTFKPFIIKNNQFLNGQFFFENEVYTPLPSRLLNSHILTQQAMTLMQRTYSEADLFSFLVDYSYVS